MYLYFHTKREWVAWLAVSLVTAGFLHFLSARAGFGFDACDYYIAAEDWLAGTRPYGDFFQTKTPGIIFLTGALFKFISSRAEWLPWYTTAVNLGWAAAAAWSVAPLIGRRLALWTFPGSLAVSLCCMANFWNTEQPMLLFAALGVGCWLRSTGPSMRVVAGALIGAAALFKLFALLPLASLLALTVLSRRRARVRSAALLAAGFAVPLLLTGIWAVGAGVFVDAWRQSVVTPLFGYASHTEYMGDFLRRIGWFVIPAGIGMFGSLVVGWNRRDTGFVLAFIGLPFLLTLFKNQAAHYVIPFVPYAVAWILWLGDRLWEPLSKSVRRVAWMSAASLVLLLAIGLASYKRASFARLFAGPSADPRPACGKLAQWVGDGDRAIFINAGPYPHVALYWMTGTRPYPWPFIALSGFVKEPIQEFGYGRFRDLCADPKTRLLGIRFDVPIDPTLPWVFSPEQLRELEQIVGEQFEPIGEFPGVYLRKGSVRASKAFPRGPYRGDVI